MKQFGLRFALLFSAALLACAQTDVNLPAPAKPPIVSARTAESQANVGIGPASGCNTAQAVCPFASPIAGMTHGFTLAKPPSVGSRICITMRRAGVQVNQQCPLAPPATVTDQLIRRTIRLALTNLEGGETFDFSYETE